MVSLRQTLMAATCATATVDAAMGPAFSTGPVASDSFISEAIATLILPDTPPDSTGLLSLWVGMGTSKGDLIQSIADNDQSLPGNPQKTQWGVFAYTLDKTGENSQEPIKTERRIFAAGDQITMHCKSSPSQNYPTYQSAHVNIPLDKYDDTSKNYTQTVLVNGVESATLETSDGLAQGWGSAVECAATNCGTVPAHSWINASIILDVANPNYGNTLRKGDGVTGSMSTSDGGKTWEIGTIGVPQVTF